MQSLSKLSTNHHPPKYIRFKRKKITSLENGARLPFNTIWSCLSTENLSWGKTKEKSAVFLFYFPIFKLQSFRWYFNLSSRQLMGFWRTKVQKHCQFLSTDRKCTQVFQNEIIRNIFVWKYSMPFPFIFRLLASVTVLCYLISYMDSMCNLLVELLWLVTSTDCVVNI